MATETNEKLAGEIVFESSAIQRDREANDGETILGAILKEVQQFADSRDCKTQEGKMLANLLIRLIEIEKDGAPSTPPPLKHHV